MERSKGSLEAQRDDGTADNALFPEHAASSEEEDFEEESESSVLEHIGITRYQQLLANEFVTDFRKKFPLYQQAFSSKAGRQKHWELYNAWLTALKRVETYKVPFKEGDLEYYKQLSMCEAARDIQHEKNLPQVPVEEQPGECFEAAETLFDEGHRALVLGPITRSVHYGKVQPRRLVNQGLRALILPSLHRQILVGAENSTTQTLPTQSSTAPPPSPSRGFTDSQSAMDNRLQLRPPQETSLVKAKALEDARKAQAQVIEECKKKGKDPPPYVLEELIGKGSFGRVYRGKDMKTADIVAVKIIDIDESDTLNPRQADSYSEFLKEVNALRLLSETKAKNINHVLEALPVGKSMWMIIEYCAGGSVATLMKPTSPGGLNEKWIIPILREVALALRYCHEAGIIHRDVKCANVLITEQGNVQLCDFGVAGIIENKTDKRSTIIGTPHWMAPELFNLKTSSYGTEVDIWAFGCMAFELATGSPPFATQYHSVEQLAAALQHQTPRLEDTNDTRFSDALKDVVAFCIQDDPKARPAIEAVQQHKYLLNTDSKYPASSLRSLVGSFKVWEARGGSRKSLFFQHGAQPEMPSTDSSNEDWIFSTTANFDLEVYSEYGLKDVIDAYGPDAAAGFEEDTSRPSRRQPVEKKRRRPPPEALAPLPAPLEKIFDPNTMSNYEENSRRQYGGSSLPSSTSDLQLRGADESSIRVSIIDLDATVDGTIRPSRPANDAEDDYVFQDFNRPARSDPADVNPNRQTRDWKFPAMVPPASADPELSRFPTSFELPRPTITPGSGGRPTLVHHPTEPLGAFGGSIQASLPSDRLSMRSLIDLDMSMPDSIPEYRPSTADSDAASTTSEHPVSANPFELEKHASLYQPVFGVGREPSIYADDGPYAYENSTSTLKDLTEMSDFSASDAEGPNHDHIQYDEDGYYAVNTPAANGNGISHGQASSIDEKKAFDSVSMPPPRPSVAQSVPRGASQSTGDSTFDIPSLPDAPSIEALTGTATQDEMVHEVNRMMTSMSAQLISFKNVFQDSELVQKRGSVRREPVKSSSVDE